MSDYPNMPSDESYEPRHAEVVPQDQQSQPFLVLNSFVYEWLRASVEVLLPGAATLYLALATIWHLPGGEKVSATLAAVAVFLGLIVRLARRSYNKSDAKYDGVMNVEQTDETTKTMSLELNAHPDALENKSQILFKVNKQ